VYKGIPPRKIARWHGMRSATWQGDAVGSNRPYASRTNLGKYSQYHPLPRFGFIFKSGNSLLESQCFLAFQVLLEPCCQHGSNGV